MSNKYREYRLFRKLTSHGSGARVYWQVREKTEYGYKPLNTPWIYKDEDAIDVIEYKAYKKAIEALKECNQFFNYEYPGQENDAEKTLRELGVL